MKLTTYEKKLTIHTMKRLIQYDYNNRFHCDLNNPRVTI